MKSALMNNLTKNDLVDQLHLAMRLNQVDLALERINQAQKELLETSQTARHMRHNISSYTLTPQCQSIFPFLCFDFTWLDCSKAIKDIKYTFDIFYKTRPHGLDFSSFRKGKIVV